MAGLFCSSLKLHAQSIVINEVMASNSRTIMDEDEDYPDWIELYNTGSQTVNLENYGLSDDYDRPYRWIMPDIELSPGDFLLLWASGKDRKEDINALHTNFSISSDGEEIIVTSPEGERIDEMPPTPIPTDISYGRRPDGSNDWFFFDSPTPGSYNLTEEGLSPAPGKPRFSHDGGFYKNPFALTITTDDPEAKIIYTLDGSDPDPENLDGKTYTYKNQYPEDPDDEFGPLLENSIYTHEYESPIPIYNRAEEEDKLTHIATTRFSDPSSHTPSSPVFKGTTVKARIIKDGYLPGKVVSNNYYISDKGLDRYSFPIISITVPEQNLFDYENGIYVAGEDFDQWRENNPDDNSSPQSPANYQRRGIEAEKHAHLQFFDQQKGLVLHQDFGLRVHGGASRSFAQKSFRLYARNSYGSSHFEHKVFPDQDYTQYKRIMLRNSGQDHQYTFFRDLALQKVAGPLLFDKQASEASVVFLNGEYWGIFNMRERYDKHYFSRKYDLDSENIDFLSNKQSVTEGDANHYQKMLDYFEENGIVEDEHYEYIKTQMDVECFNDYYIFQIYIQNIDWPSNNIDYWRYRVDYQPDAPYGKDGKWRWVLYDLDLAFNSYSAYRHNTLEFATATDGPGWPNPPWSTFLIRKLLENQDFENMFINRFNDLLNTIFTKEHVVGILDSLEEQYQKEIEEHNHRWNTWEDIDEWKENINVMKNFANRRPEYVRNHIRDYFDLGEDVSVTFDVLNADQGYVRVNSLDIRKGTEGLPDEIYPFDRSYFGGVPLELEAIPQPGYRFVGWSSTDNDSTAVTFTPSTDTTITAIFEPDTGAHLLHYWSFNEGETTPSYTHKDAALDIHEEESTAVSFTSGGGFDGENARQGDKPGKNLVVDQAEGSAIEFTIPTTGYENIIMSFEISGTGPLAISYIDENGSTLFRQLELSGQSPFVHTVDFSDVAIANHHHEFTVRMAFGQNSNFRFDNITVEGDEIDGANMPPEVADKLPFLSLIEGGDQDTLSLDTIFSDPEEDELSYTVEYEGQAQATIEDNKLILTPFQRGGGTISLEANDGHNTPVSCELTFITYPKPAILSDEDFVFAEWDESTPEHTFPDHMIYLQSDTDDPGVNYPLLYPYHIEADEYHSDDAHAIGFPYMAGRRTRLNGLGDEGISMINTGRGRDLGGVLVALNTEGISNIRSQWLCGTILENSRKYGIRLFYRIGHSDEFKPIGNSTEAIYQSRYDGDKDYINDTGLPDEIYDQEYVQLLWRYYHISGYNGPRAQLRLDDIIVGSSPGPTKILDKLVFNNQIKVTWLEANKATHYNIQVSLDEDFVEIIQEHETEDTELILDNLPEDQQFYVRVRGVKYSNTGPWSMEGPWSTRVETYLGENINEERKAMIFPNPSTGKITIRFYAGSSLSPVKINLFDMMGRHALNLSDGTFSPGYHTIDADLTTLLPGTYIVSIETEDGYEQQKIVKMD